MSGSSRGTALVIGGTRFIGRHTVEELHEAGYTVTTFTRGTHPDPFLDRKGITNRTGDRTDQEALAAAKDTVDPDVVIDCVAYHPDEVATATDLFSDARYVYVSSGSAYAGDDVPFREGKTRLHDCTPEEATAGTPESYGPRKAEGDRQVFAAADDGVEAMSVRPMLVYGPYDYTERFGYWVARVAEYDRVLVPGDGGSLLHRSYVNDVARALRIVAEQGAPGAAYNVADRNAVSLAKSLELIADALDTDVEVVTASERELAAHGLEPDGFPLYVARPALAATDRLADLGWDSTPRYEAIEHTANAHVTAGVTGPEDAPARNVEATVLGALGE